MLEHSLQCVVNLILDESVHESIFMALGVEPLIFFLIALCISPVLLVLYKKRVTALMSTRADDSAVELLATLDESSAASDQGAAIVEFGQGTKEALWNEALSRRALFDKQILQTVAVYLGLLLTAMIAGNLHELTDSWIENFVEMAAYGLFLGLLATSILGSVGGKKRLITAIWCLSIPLLAVVLYVESLSDPDVLNSEGYLAIGFILFFMLILYVGIAGRQMRNIVPYLTVAMSLSGLFMHLLYQFYELGACAFNAQTSEAEYLAIALAIFVAGVLMTGWFIRWVAEKYEQKSLSDFQIQISCWIIFVAIMSLLVFQVEDEDSVALRLVAIPVPFICLFSLWFYLRESKGVGGIVSPQRLLLLRVFSTDKRGEIWLSKVEKIWRHIGPVYLIAGPDLAKTGIDPHELYRFLTRRLKSLFINSEKQAVAQLNKVDNQADPDGRYRINEFFCLDDSWERVAQGLIERSDVVVLDLRDFELSRIGTAKEITFLAKASAFARTLLLVSDAADTSALIDVVQQLTGLTISPDQFLVAGNIPAEETVLRILDLREKNLSEQYLSSEPSNAAYLFNTDLQQAERSRVRQALLHTHEQTRYGVDYLVLAIGLLGLWSLAIQLLAPLYLLVRRVSLKKSSILLVTTMVSALLTHALVPLSPMTDNANPTDLQLFTTLVMLVVFCALWSVIWVYLSRKARRWIKESQEPLRTALKLQKPDQ